VPALLRRVELERLVFQVSLACGVVQ